MDARLGRAYTCAVMAVLERIDTEETLAERLPPARELALSALLLGVTAVWGWTFIVVKEAITHAGVFSFLTLRFALAALVMAPFALRSMTPRTWRVGCGIGVLLGLSYILQTVGLVHTTATNSGLITGLFVVFAPLWNGLLYGVRTDWVFRIQVAVSLLGLALLTGIGPAPLAVGDLLTFGCAVAFGAHIALLDRHSREHDPRGLALAQLVAATTLFALLWPCVEPLRIPVEVRVWGAIALCAVAATALGFYAQTLAQRRLPAVRTAIILTMEPVFAALFGRWLGAEELRPVQMLGGLLMVGAVLGASLHSPASKASGEKAV